MPVAHACNPSYLRGRDQEDHGLKPAWANNSWDSVSKIPMLKQGWQSGSSDRVPSMKHWVQTLVLPKKKKCVYI
jgi:hypothetical protein